MTDKKSFEKNKQICKNVVRIKTRYQDRRDRYACHNNIILSSLLSGIFKWTSKKLIIQRTIKRGFPMARKVDSVVPNFTDYLRIEMYIKRICKNTSEFPSKKFCCC